LKSSDSAPGTLLRHETRIDIPATAHACPRREGGAGPAHQAQQDPQAGMKQAAQQFEGMFMQMMS
jgi:hypothetical protein